MHQRDVVEKLLERGVQQATDFLWISQMRSLVRQLLVFVSELFIHSKGGEWGGDRVLFLFYCYSIILPITYHNML